MSLSLTRHLRRLVRRFVQVQRHSRFRFGRIVHLQGRAAYGKGRWCQHTAIGLVGQEYGDGNWLGGMSWRRHGPIAVCRYKDPVRR